MCVVRPIGPIAQMIAGGEVEAAPMITGSIDLVGVPEAFEIVAHPGDRARSVVRPAGA